jgi:hypothetical protein
MWAMTSGVFFQRLAACAAGPYALALDILGQQLASPACHCADIQAQEFGNAGIASMAGLERLKTGVEPPLLLIEQTAEQHNRRPQLIGQNCGFGNRPDQSGLGQHRATGQELLASAAGVDCAIQIPP